MKTKIAKSDIDEMKTLHCPPRAITFVLSATMLLLGNGEQIAKVTVDLIPVEAAQLARQWQGDLAREVIMKTTKAAAPFFEWNQEVIESVLARSG